MLKPITKLNETFMILNLFLKFLKHKKNLQLHFFFQQTIMFLTIIMIMCSFETTSCYNVALESKSLLQPFEYKRETHGNFGQSFTFKRDDLHSWVFSCYKIECIFSFVYIFIFEINPVYFAGTQSLRQCQYFHHLMKQKVSF